MSKVLPEFEQVESWSDLCQRFGELMNLGGPAPLPVVRRAMQDDLFAHYLVVTRNSPQMQQMLLQDPKNKAYETPVDAPKHSSPALVARAAKAMVKWGKAGFERVDQGTYAQRTEACQRCPYLVDPPDLTAYKMLKLAGDRRVCAKCGCVASRKAQVPTERCPVADPKNPGLNRWGQPMQ